jgi:hypothetical protein
MSQMVLKLKSEDKQKHLRNKNHEREMKSQMIKQRKVKDEMARLSKASKVRQQSLKDKENLVLKKKAGKFEKERLLQDKKEREAEERKEAREASNKVKSIESYYNN